MLDETRPARHLPSTAPPPRPSPARERWGRRLFFGMAPRLQRVEQPQPPPGLAPYDHVRVPRRHGEGTLGATWYPAPSDPRGAVLLLPPWLKWGRAYFHRRRRVPALREAGYHVLTLDFPGFGGSGPVLGYFDRDVEDGLDYLAGRAAGLPLHVWGVSSGGYWAHMVLAQRGGVSGAFFEEVSHHLLEWSRRTSPWARPIFRLFPVLFPQGNRFLDLREHAPALRVRRVAYVSGENDPGVLPEDTRELARLAGAEVLIVPEAEHLEAIKVAEERVIGLALATFAAAERDAVEALASGQPAAPAVLPTAT